MKNLQIEASKVGFLKRRLPEVVLLSIAVFAAAMLIAQARTPATATVAPSNTEVQILKAQLETIREYDQRLMNVVFWSLGGVFIVVVLIGGLNWFTNYRLYERERESLREYLQGEFKSESAQVHEVMRHLEEESRSSFNTFFQDAKSQFRNDFAEFRKENEKGLERTRTDLHHEIQESKSDLAQFKAEQFQKQGDSLWESFSLLDFLEIQIELKRVDPLYVADSLKRIIAILEKEHRVSYTSAKRLERILKSLPDTLSSEAGRIASLLPQCERFGA